MKKHRIILNKRSSAITNLAILVYPWFTPPVRCSTMEPPETHSANLFHCVWMYSSIPGDGRPFHLVQVYFKSPSHSVDRVICRPSLQAQTRTLIITLDSHLEDLQNTTKGNSVIESSMLYPTVRETRQKETNPWQVAVYGDVSTAPVSTQWTMPCRCLTSSMSATIPGTRSLWHSYEEEFSRLEWLAE